MKNIASLLLLATGAAFAGEPAPVYEKSPVMPPAPSLYEWFAGGTVGYLLDNEEGMYTGHLGVDLPNQLAGFDQALYLEIGYTELSDCRTNSSYDSEYDPTPQAVDSGQYRRACLDLEIIPITLNYKLEKALSNNLNWYFGGGAGVALIEAGLGLDGSNDSDDDTVFYAQAFTGVLYNVNPSFEVFAGARYIYFDEPGFNFDAASLDWSDIESAFDFENGDVLLEAGGRVNF